MLSSYPFWLIKINTTIVWYIFFVVETGSTNTHVVTYRFLICTNAKTIKISLTIFMIRNFFLFSKIRTNSKNLFHIRWHLMFGKKKICSHNTIKMSRTENSRFFVWLINVFWRNYSTFICCIYLLHCLATAMTKPMMTMMMLNSSFLFSFLFIQCKFHTYTHITENLINMSMACNRIQLKLIRLKIWKSNSQWLNELNFHKFIEILLLDIL